MWMLALLPIGMLIAGSAIGDLAAHRGTAALVTSYGTRTIVKTHTVERKVRGKVVYAHDEVFVHVPLVLVHVDHRVIRVPAHRLPLGSASATVANPLVTVSVQVPTTIYLPSDPVTVTSTVTTQLPPITTTITLPPLPVDDANRSGG